MLDNELPPLGGGMGTANLALLKHFAQLPLEIDVITSALGGRSEFELYSDRIRIFKVPVWNRNIHHSTNRELILYALQSFFVSLRLLRSTAYDFCFAWSAVPAGGVALALHGLRRLPYMVWVSGPDIPGFEQRYVYLYRLLTPIIKSVWRYASPLIAKCSEEVAMIQAVAKDQPVLVIPNGVDLSFFQPGQPVSYGAPLKVICVARLIERKGQHHLIQAVKKLKDDGVDVIVNLVGTGDSMAEYQQLVASLNVADRVRFAGYVPREEIARHYAAADVFVLPSFNEGLSLAALEAMSAGLPLILTHTGGTNDLVVEGVNGFTFAWGDFGGLAAHLERLALDPHLARQMGAASRSRAPLFSWDTISSRYLELFKTFQRNPHQFPVENDVKSNQ
jgi:glycosyltransferase involved in cell wall biosynthesis